MRKHCGWTENASLNCSGPVWGWCWKPGAGEAYRELLRAEFWYGECQLRTGRKRVVDKVFEKATRWLDDSQRRLRKIKGI
jgi:hypothetical protein